MQRFSRSLQCLRAGNTTQQLRRAYLSRPQFSTAASGQHLQLPRTRPFSQPAPLSTLLARHNSNLTAPASADPKPSTTNQASRPDQPSYQLTFTCKPCKHRSAHRISKQGYHRGTVLIQCPSCKNRHVVSDHLKIFMDEASTLEDILRTQGALIKKGRLGIRQGKVVGNEGEEDIEFWEDGSETPHKDVEN